MHTKQKHKSQKEPIASMKRECNYREYVELFSQQSLYNPAGGPQIPFLGILWTLIVRTRYVYVRHPDSTYVCTMA
jgi:hypothetical protein